MNEQLLQDNKKLVDEFGASPIASLKDAPNFYTFKRGLVYSHRDFDKFYSLLKAGKKCAIVSGFNASGQIHLGHKAVFDTNLFFQKEFGVPIFIPISDDESYVSGKVKTQKEGLENSLKLASELIAYGFDSKKTFFIIDQIYTTIYNLAIKLSRRTTLSAIKATYGYSNEENPGLFFYPTVQAAHILLPIESFGYDYVLVPIGPDEDAHLRTCRDVAAKEGYNVPAVLHLAFLPGIDGEKMSKSKNNAIFLHDSPKIIRGKVASAFSGGAKTKEEQIKFGGNPEVDVACLYLKTFFLAEAESKKLFDDYRKGKILSGEVKHMLAEKVVEFTQKFQSNLAKISLKDVQNSILKNKEFKFK
jgi:tryptophanyl-tRNA synthetase